MTDWMRAMRPVGSLPARSSSASSMQCISKVGHEIFLRFPSVVYCVCFCVFIIELSISYSSPVLLLLCPVLVVPCLSSGSILPCISDDAIGWELLR